MSDGAKGILAMIGACCIWGLSGLYYKILGDVPPLEVLAHRTFWSLVFFGLVLAAQSRLGEIPRLIGDRRVLRRIALATAAISVNWFLFIYSIQTGRALEASLGYYIFPLVAVGLGFAVLGEALSRMQWAAVGLAVFAVAVLTAGLGVAPWISLTLAGTFGTYGLVKSRVAAGPVVSVTTEVLLVAPLSLGYLAGAHLLGWGWLGDGAPGAFGASWRDSLLLMASGPITAGPLILLSYATRRVRYATVGVLQYLNPTLQFLVATLIFAEPLTRWHAVAFPLIWTGLALYSAEIWRAGRAARRAASSAATEGTTST